MKLVTLHPASVLLGLALAGVLTILAGAAQTPIPARRVLVGEIPADWWASVRLNVPFDGTPPDSYAIPQGKYFVVTKITGDGLLVDGIDMSVDLGGVAIEGNGTRVTLPAGALLTGKPGNSHFVHIWGYLEPVR